MQDKTPLLNGEVDPYETLREQYEALRSEADANGHRLVLRGLRDDEWDDLVEAHPPRTDDKGAEEDKGLGFNKKTGLRALVFATIVEPEFPTRTRFDDWIAETGLTRGELTTIAAKSLRLTNGSGPVDPKSLPLWPTRDAEES